MSNYYKAYKIMRSENSESHRIIDLWRFKSIKSNKVYIVEVEHFSHKFLGIKFYWKGVSLSPRRYSLLTNDNEPRAIILSCVHIMMEYIKNDPFVSYGFVAAPDLTPKKNNGEGNSRFRFYRRMMLSIFNSNTFLQVQDSNKSIYLLVNRQAYELGEITLDMIESDLCSLYYGDYSLSLT